MADDEECSPWGRLFDCCSLCLRGAQFGGPGKRAYNLVILVPRQFGASALPVCLLLTPVAQERGLPCRGQRLLQGLSRLPVERGACKTWRGRPASLGTKSGGEMRQDGDWSGARRGRGASRQVCPRRAQRRPRRAADARTRLDLLAAQVVKAPGGWTARDCEHKVWYYSSTGALRAGPHSIVDSGLKFGDGDVILLDWSVREGALRIARGVASSEPARVGFSSRSQPLPAMRPSVHGSALSRQVHAFQYLPVLTLHGDTVARKPGEARDHN